MKEKNSRWFFVLLALSVEVSANPPEPAPVRGSAESTRVLSTPCDESMEDLHAEIRELEERVEALEKANEPRLQYIPNAASEKTYEQ